MAFPVGECSRSAADMGRTVRLPAAGSILLTPNKLPYWVHEAANTDSNMTTQEISETSINNAMLTPSGAHVNSTVVAVSKQWELLIGSGSKTVRVRTHAGAVVAATHAALTPVQLGFRQVAFIKCGRPHTHKYMWTHAGSGRKGVRVLMHAGAVVAASNAALALVQLGDEPAAIKEMQKASRRAPGSADLRAALAALYWSQVPPAFNFWGSCGMALRPVL